MKSRSSSCLFPTLLAALLILVGSNALGQGGGREGRGRGQGGGKKMTIAAIFDEGSDVKYEVAFRHAVQWVNRKEGDILHGIDLHPEVVRVRPDDTFSAERKTCHLLEKGVVAILGPLSKYSSEHIRSITDSMEIPYIETRWNYRSQDVIGKAGGEYAFNLHPDITTLSQAYLDLLEAYQWTTITILYQDNDSMMTLKAIFEKTFSVLPSEKFRIVVRKLEKTENGYRDALMETLLSESKLIMLDCEKIILEEVLIQCQQVGLVSQGFYFFLTSLDAHTVNLENFKYGGTNFSAFRMVDVDKPEVSNVIFNIVSAMVDKELGYSGIPAGNILLHSGCGQQSSKSCPTGNLDTTTALIYDSVHAFAIALHNLDKIQQVSTSIFSRIIFVIVVIIMINSFVVILVIDIEKVQQQRLDCSGDEAWVHGNSLVNYMKVPLLFPKLVNCMNGNPISFKLCVVMWPKAWYFHRGPSF